ncbi:MAG: hypothetical protein AB1894_27275 [Chloroflexota bacterium]
MTLKRHHRRSIRLKGYDYTRVGAYFVTIVADERQELFGTVVDGEMRLSRAGEIVRKAWFDLPRHYPNVRLDEFCIMPNHVHGIIILTEDDVRNEGGKGGSVHAGGDAPETVVYGEGSVPEVGETRPYGDGDDDDGRGGSVQGCGLGPDRVASGNVPTPGTTQTRPFGDGDHDRGGEQGGSVHAYGDARETVMYGEGSVPEVGETRPYGDGDYPHEPEEQTPSHTTRPDDAYPIGDGDHDRGGEQGGSVHAGGDAPETVLYGEGSVPDVGETRPYGDGDYPHEPGGQIPSHAARPFGDGNRGDGGDYGHGDDQGGSVHTHGQAPETVLYGEGSVPDVGETRPYGDAGHNHGGDGDRNDDDGGDRGEGRRRHGLPEIVRAFKSFSARQVNFLRRTSGAPVWQRNYYEHIVRNEEEMAHLQEYIRQNPLRWENDQENPERQMLPQPKDKRPI